MKPQVRYRDALRLGIFFYFVASNDKKKCNVNLCQVDSMASPNFFSILSFYFTRRKLDVLVEMVETCHTTLP